MRYSGGLVKKEREQVFRLFLENSKLKFSEIEKVLGIRSNMVAYHLEQMQKEGLLEKSGEFYRLTKTGERYIPIFQHIIGQSLSPLSIVLVAVINKNKILLMKRNRRPYKDYWSMIGGKMLLEETFKDATLRLVKQRTDIDAEFLSANAILHERVEGEGIIKHSFILFFTKVKSSKNSFKETSHGKLKWFNLKGIEKQRIIPSDLWLIKNKLNSKIAIKNAYMFENEGELAGFRILK